MKPEQWLALNKKELDIALAKVLTPGPWKHLWGEGVIFCQKCNQRYAMNMSEHCPVPDPIDSSDWNVAMEIYRQYEYIVASRMLAEVYVSLTDFNDIMHDSLGLWEATKAQPHHYLIAAALATEAE